MNYFLVFIALLTVGFQNTFYSQEEENNPLSINETEDVPDTNRVDDTFYSTRIINGHSTETLRKGVMEFRVEHRFGDIAGDAGGVQTMFGFDNSSDIRIALEYGITRDLMVGFGRSKGTGSPYKSLLDGFVKYKFLAQKKIGSPVSISALATTSFSYMKASSDISQVNAFPKWQHRLAYTAQLNIARKFNDRISLALIPTMVHRNYVATDDLNTLFSIGGAARFGINSKMAILLEYYQVLHGNDVRGTNTNSLGIAFEWITFGHNFTLNLTNSKGFGETQFIPYTYEKWSKGQFRLGFCIGRKFEKE
ncbi:MAG: hypothetical protein RL679_1911 [Bacteroidota bacterium]|jgi:hypothetical protein